MANIFKSLCNLSQRVISCSVLCSKRLLSVSAHHSTNEKKERPSTDSLIMWDRLPVPKAPPKDRWTSKAALFGENDYKDLLGDGTYPLRKNVKTGPFWLRGWKGHELQRLLRKRNIEGSDLGPQAKKELNKRIKYLYRRANRNLGKWYYRAASKD